MLKVSGEEIIHQEAVSMLLYSLQRPSSPQREEKNKEEKTKRAIRGLVSNKSMRNKQIGMRYRNK